MTATSTARTLLFVPGSRPERFPKALAAGADLVVVDLEDAVAPAAKDDARSAVVDWLSTLSLGDAGQVVVRINAADTPWHGADLDAMAGRTAGVIVPKAVAGSALEEAGRRTPVVALVETATGVLDARDVARTAGVVRLAFGSFDLAAELGVDPLDADALRAARSAVVLASADAGLAGPVDGVHAAVDDVDALTAETAAARRLGFAGKLCIHPRQVAVVASVLRPSEEEIAWAERILAATPDADERGVVTVDGRMVDKPVIDRARRIAASAQPGRGTEHA